MRRTPAARDEQRSSDGGHRLRARVSQIHVVERAGIGSVRDVIAGRIRIPESDVVYASGLFDYPDPRAGGVLLKRMFASVKVGGSVLIPNLTPHNDEVGYMEAVMDWWMCYRTEADMRELAALLHADQAQFRTTTYLGSDNRIAWLQIDRLG